MIEEPLFISTHDALKFAFQYASLQSPRTPLMSMSSSGIDREDAPPRRINNNQTEKPKGLDAAAQAGMILAEVCRLPDEQHNVIVARYDKKQIVCNGCHRPYRSDEWYAAIEYLTQGVELEGVHRRVRFMMVEKAVCGGKMDMETLCKRYSLSKSTTYRQLSEIKVKFRKIERIALINLDNSFSQKKLLVA